MKTLIVELYKNYQTRIAIELEFQIANTTVKNGTTTITNNVFINQKNDYGNFKLQPYIKFIYTYIDAIAGKVITTSPIYLNAYHIYDLKTNFKRMMKVLEAPNAYKTDENGHLSIKPEYQKQSAWEFSEIGAKQHFIRGCCGVYQKDNLDGMGNVINHVEERGVYLSFDTMKDKGVQISLAEFKCIYALINDINIVNLMMQAGISELIHATSKGTTNSIYEKPKDYKGYHSSNNIEGMNVKIANTQQIVKGNYQRPTGVKPAVSKPNTPNTTVTVVKPAETKQPVKQEKPVLPARSESNDVVPTEKPSLSLTKAVSEMQTNIDDIPETTFDSDDDEIDKMFED